MLENNTKESETTMVYFCLLAFLPLAFFPSHSIQIMWTNAALKLLQDKENTDGALTMLCTSISLNYWLYLSDFKVKW